MENTSLPVNVVAQKRLYLNKPRHGSSQLAKLNSIRLSRLVAGNFNRDGRSLLPATSVKLLVWKQYPR